MWKRLTFRKINLSIQISILLLTIPVILVVSLLYYSALLQVDIKNKPYEQLAASTSITVSEKLDRCLSERHGDIQAFSSNTLLSESLTNKSKIQEVEEFFNNMVKIYKVYDLLMLCDIEGKVITCNSTDKSGNSIATTLIKNQNMSTQEWFKSSIVTGGPAGGAFFSDFYTDENLQFLNQNGWGMDFSAPVYDSSKEIIGVLRSRINWKETTQLIRKEAEIVLQQNVNNALILLLNKQGLLIDADDENNIMKVNIGKNNLMKNFGFYYSDIDVNSDDYTYGWSESKGFERYSGNKWKFLTIIPKVKSTDISLYLNSDWLNLLLFSLTILLIGILAAMVYIKIFSKRLLNIKNSVLSLAKGEPLTIAGIRFLDEIGEMSEAVNQLSNNFLTMADFSQKIGAGNLSAEYKPAGDKDVLGNSLVQMKENIIKAETENKIQKIISNTLSKLGEILRDQEDDEIKLNRIISFLSKSINAHQGILYGIYKDSNIPYLSIKGSYALEENRLVNDYKIYLGEGATGQAAMNNETVRLRNLPEDYINRISSGLGEASPKEIIIIPIIYNETTEGVMEFSSFYTFDEYKIHLLEKAGEYIGSYFLQKRFQVLQEDKY